MAGFVGTKPKREYTPRTPKPKLTDGQITDLINCMADKLRAFQRNIKSYMESHQLTEEQIGELPLEQQPKNYREKVRYKAILEILEGMK